MTIRYVDIPPHAQTAFCLAWEAHKEGRNTNGIEGAWYWSHCEGVIVVRRADIKKYPLHDMGPDMKQVPHESQG